jgi:hypothetical protein
VLTEAERAIASGMYDRPEEETWQLLRDNWPAVERGATLFMEQPRRFSQAEIDAAIQGRPQD